MTTTASRSPILRPLARIMALVIGIQPGLASAQVVADPRAPQNQQPQVGQAANGVPLVNIQTPSAAGVSRNTYQQFDVNRQGVILNNAQKNAATQLGGWVEGNANLKKGSARIILNEVNSMSPSQLRGYMEIAGSKAQLVVANPAGITCDGCGFINANRATLTTGTPIFEGGNLTGYRVQGGRIAIEGQGLDARGVDYTDIITRAVTINSGLWAEHLNIVTGTNQVSTDLSQITPIAANPDDPPPAFAVDVASLGGMYAGKIFLVGTEAGLGVINAGHIGAAVGDVVITVDGRLESKGSLNSTGNTQITARQGIQNEGTLYAQGNVTLNTSGDITNNKIIAAAGNTSLSGHNIQGARDNLIAAGLQPDNTLAASGILTLNAGQTIDLQHSDLVGHTQRLNAAQLQLANSRIQGNSLYLTASGNADLQGSRINLSGLLNTRINGLLDTRSAQIAATQLQLSAQHLNNQSGQLLQTGTGTGYITATGTLDNQDGQIISNGQLLQLTAATLDNRRGILVSNGSLTANLEQLNNQNGNLTAVDQLTLTATGALTNTAGLIRAGGNLQLQADSLDNRNTQGSNQGIEAQSLAFAIRHIDNTGGALRAEDTFTVGSRQLDNTNGFISSAQTLSLDGTSRNTGDSLAVTNAGGTLIAGNNLSLIAASLAGIGDILSQGDMSLTFTGSFTNGSRIIAEQNLQLSVADILTNQGAIKAGGALELEAQHFENTAQAELSSSVLTLNLDSLTNRGLIDGSRAWIQSQTINNLGTGRIYGDYLSILAHTVNQSGEGQKAPVIAGRDRLYMGLDTLNNREHGLIFSAGNLKIGATVDSEGTVTGQANRITNASATIEALGDLQLAANTLENLNLHHSVEEIIVSQTYIEEYQGMGYTERYLPSQIYFRDVRDDYYQLVTPDGVRHDKFYLYQYTRTVTETREASSDPGRILSGGMMAIDAGSVLNDKSQIIAGGDLNVVANTLTNTEVKGWRTVTDTGVAIYHKDQQPGGSGNDWTEKKTIAYNPAAFQTEIDITPTVYLAYNRPNGSNYSINDLNTGNVSQQPGTVGDPTTVGNIITIPPNIRLPNNSLYTLNPDSGSRYLIETDPRFANYRQWLNSDYMLSILNIDMAGIQKRLGDGFYEQQLIREQIGQLTGRRFLEGYADDEAQYQALLEAGATFAQAHQLIPGVGLTEAQMAALTSDIVWLVEKEVTLPDGSTTRALVPQVYALVQPGDLQGNGALIAGRNIDIQAAGKILNQGGILGQENILLQADNITNQGGRISGNTLTLDAASDIQHQGGLLEGKSNLYLLAGRDISVSSSTGSTQSTQGARTHLNQVATILTRNPEGMLIMDAGRDINLKAADIRNEAEGGQTLIAAGRDLTLETLGVSARQDLIFDKKNTRKENASTEIGTSIATQGDLTLLAGNNLTARAANISSNAGGISVQAGKDILLTSGEENSSLYSSSYTKSKGSWGSTREVTTRDYTQSIQALGTLLSGETVQMQAGQDITLHGSQALSTQAMNLTAGRDINLEAAQETRQETHYYNKKQKGIFSTGGAGIMIGKQEQSTDGKGASTYAAASTVGSVEGNVTLVAGRNYTQTGSHVVAPGGDIGIAADQILIQEARETDAYQQKTKFKQSGLTIALSNPIISAIQMTERMNKSASHVGNDSRQKALGAASSIFAIDSALGSINPAGSNPVQQAGGLNISVSLGSSKSESDNRRNSNTASGSTVTAGGNITLLAKTENQDGNITIQGSNLTAGKNMTLVADRDIQLLAAQNTAEQRSKNKSSSNSVGVSVGVGANGGIGVSAVISANKGRGNADGSSVAWSNSHLLAGDMLTLISGGDLTLRGATAQGDTLLASVGGNLIVESLQDTDRYKSEQKSSGFSLTIPIYGTNAGASISKGKTDIDSTYRSVTEQSALKAGDGGFGVDVGGNTTLVGGAIVSTQEAIDRGNNYFSTGGELTLIDLKNKAEYEGKGYGVNIGAVPSDKGTFTPGGSSGGVGHESGEAESTTHAAISDMAGKESARTGDKETGIDRIFDAEKVQQSIDAQIEITRNFGQQASKLVGDYAATQIKTATDLRARAESTTDKVLADSLNAQAQLLEDQWGANGTLRLAAHTLIGGLTGGWEGALGSTVGTLTAAEVESTLRAGGMDADLTKALSTLASTLAGGAAAGTTGASTAFNEVTNNYLDHVESWALYVATKNCSAGNTGACAERDRLRALDDKRDAEMMIACREGFTDTCKQLMHQATIAMGTLPFERGSNVFGALPKDYIEQITAQYQKNDIAYRIASGEKPEDIQASNKNYNLVRYVSGLATKALTVVGDVDDFINAETPGDYAWFVAGIIPGVGETRKALKGLDELNDARKVLSKTDEAAKVAKESGIVGELTNITQQQLDKKFKHAADFGIVTTKKNPETLAQFESAIKSHMASPSTVQQGTYGFVKDSKVFFNPTTNNAVVVDNAGNFVTGFKLSPGTLQFDNFIKNGVLR